jgi:hypothetical protein
VDVEVDGDTGTDTVELQCRVDGFFFLYAHQSMQHVRKQILHITYPLPLSMSSTNYA